MNHLARREFLKSSLLASAAALSPRADGLAQAPAFRIAPFRFDVTPPVGHPLCGGWITPVVDTEDALEAISHPACRAD